MRVSLIYLQLLLFLGLNQSLATDVKPGNQRIEKFVSEQGFYQNTVNAIISDSNGYLWIATPNGLVRYDGYSFEYYYHDPENQKSIPNNYIKHLLKDSDGKIWISTREGLCLYFADKEQFFPLEYKISNEAFIKEDGQKRIWIGKGSKLHIFKSTNIPSDPVSKIGVINLDEELQQEAIQDIEFLSDSQVVVATKSKLYKVSFKEYELNSATVSILHFQEERSGITKLVKKENSFWIGTDNGFYQTFLENNNLTTIRSFFNSNNKKTDFTIQVLSMFVDTENSLWIGTKQDGILKYDSKNNDFVSFTYDPKNDEGLTSNRINCFYEDAYGVMWFGTAQGGLNKLDKNQKKFYNYSHNPYNKKSLSGNLITDITEDKDGRIWFSFFENTICRTKDKVSSEAGKQITFERLEKQLGLLKDRWVQRIFQDSRGYWWIGTNRGVYLYDEKNDKLRSIEILVSDDLIKPTINRVISQTGTDQILIGGQQIYLLDNPWSAILNNKPVQVEKRLIDFSENSQVTDYVKDWFGNHWFATMNGVFRVVNNEGSWVVKNHFTSDKENGGLVLSHNNIFSIHISLNKDIWLGTFGGGLMKIQLNPAGEPEKIKSYHKKHGLPDEAVYGILEDEEGKLWISTDMGICRFDPLNEKFDIYDVNDGIINNNFRQSAYLKTKSGILLMGGLNGLTIFDPKQITSNEIPPRMLISGLKINDQPVAAGNEINKQIILERSISDTKKLVVNHRNRNISLDIIAQHNSTPKKNQVAYMLEGVNKDWIKIDGGKATATYTNLSAETYRFLYKGANGDGIWTDIADELIIEVLAPWYFRWWSFTLWGLIALMIVYVIFRYLVRLEKLKQKLKFEQLDKERVHEMDQAKLRFFTNISHEFKTPLSLIIGPIEKIEEHNRRKEDQKYFSIIQNNISRLQRLIEQLISYRKAETGHLELKYTKTTLGNFIYPLLEAFEEYAKHTNVNFFYKINMPNKQIIIDIDKTERILLNLFSNAVKFSEFNGEVRIEAGFRDEKDGEMLYVEIADTGIGIPPEKIDKIFDRFYRGVEDTGSWSGTGIGLALCKSLVDLMKGTISVDSEPGTKTVFKIALPFNNSLSEGAKDDLNKHREIVTDWLPSEFEGVQEQSTNTTLPTLLIVDDEQDVRSFLHEAFRNKYNITLAVDGEDGLEKLNENLPQLVISDVMMPKLNGYQLCERIKSNPVTCHIPVILLTALDDKDKEIKGLEMGADDYISKPFSIKHLEVRVKKLIENKQRILEYFSNSSVMPNESLNISIRDRQFIQRLTVTIEKNMSNSAFGVEELAADVGMSTSNFYRRLKELTGQAPNVYLRNFRLQKAAELLKADKDLSATEVMFEIGIESPSYFSTSFKKLHGFSPSEFVKKKS
jgi:signal transduction histidine kinase/ligand-binding sensor domain-containing protein/DNA-binding response OmpR family regulator